MVAEQPWSAATASTTILPHFFKDPVCYRGQNLTLLRYMRSMLHVQRHECNVHNWVWEQRCHMSEKRSVLGFRMTRGARDWFEGEFISQVRSWHAQMFGVQGTLLSLMTDPRENGSAQLFSAVVSGLGTRKVSMWSLGRMEWLAVELVVEAQEVCETAGTRRMTSFGQPSSKSSTGQEKKSR